MSERRQSTRREVRQARRVKKREDARIKTQEDNRERVRQNKKQKVLPGDEVTKSIWEKSAEPLLYAMTREMGDNTKNIDAYQRKRVASSAFMFSIGMLLGLIIHPWLYLAGPVLGLFWYKSKLNHVKNYYRSWKFMRQLNFSQFCRLVIPYLKVSGGNAPLYTVFNKILERTRDEVDRQSLYRLMSEMGSNPSEIQPFLDFAERSSGSDMSHLFMSTIFDYQETTFDVSTIDELGQIASNDMMKSIDEIIRVKERRFVMFPTKIVMSSFILVAGLGLSLMIYNTKDLEFSSDMISEPVQGAQTSEDMTGSNLDELDD